MTVIVAETQPNVYTPAPGVERNCLVRTSGKNTFNMHLSGNPGALARSCVAKSRSSPRARWIKPLTAYQPARDNRTLALMGSVSILSAGRVANVAHPLERVMDCLAGQAEPRADCGQRQSLGPRPRELRRVRAVGAAGGVRPLDRREAGRNAGNRLARPNPPHLPLGAL
jgi:hypothetical protein